MEAPEIKPLPATDDQRERFAATYAVLDEAIAAQAFPGCSFGILFAGNIVALDARGHFTYDERSPRVAPNSIYDLASLTKPLAATSLAMLLYDRRLLSLDQPVWEVLPAFAIGTPASSPRRRVTVRMLLDHSSGLPGYRALHSTGQHGAEAIYDAVMHTPLEAEPGTRAEYSDLGFILLTELLEKLAGERIDTICHREVFQPLCMQSTCYRPPSGWREVIPPTQERGTEAPPPDVYALNASLPAPPQNEKDGLPLSDQPYAGVNDANAAAMGGVSGHAGLFSNALDPLRYAACILAGGLSHEGKRIFKPETVELFTRRSGQPEGSSRALGWDTPSDPSSSGRYFSSHSAGHLGYTGTSLWIDLDASLAVVLLTNRTWPDSSSDAIRAVRPRFHDSITTELLPGVRMLTDLRKWVTP